MSSLPNRDCNDFDRAVSAQLRADLALIFDLALREPQSPEIIEVMGRVARAVAAERLRPEEMLRCVKALWKERIELTLRIGPVADAAWRRLVRVMLEAYYLAPDARGPATDGGLATPT